MSVVVFVLISVILILTSVVDSKQLPLSSNETFHHLPVMNQFIYPETECLTLPPITQFYYPFMFSLDTLYFDYCKLPLSSSPTEFNVNSHLLQQMMHNENVCIDFLCQHDREWDFTNKTQVVDLGILWNYCLMCDHVHGHVFRRALDQNNCTAFSLINSTRYSSDSSSDFISRFGQVASHHCNNNNGDEHLGFFDFNFLQSDYFVNTFYSFKKERFLENFSNNKDALKSVTLPTLFSFYFEKYFMDTDLERTVPPLNVPITCWCDYRTKREFSFQCYDYYHSWQLTLSYRISVFIFAVLYGCVFCYLVAFNSIPRVVERIVSFKQKPQIKLFPIWKKILFFIRHFFDIVIQPPIFFAISSGTGFIENFLRFLFNFRGVMPLYQVYFPGIFRGLAAIFMICGYSSLIISWSHVIDMSKRKGNSSSSKKLSKANTIILSLFYVAMILIGIITVIVFLVIKDYAPAWILLSAAVMVYLLTFVIGFAFYGVKILIQLRGSKGSLLEYRFTKFILFETALFVVGWLVSLFMLTTYIFGYDSISLWWGLNRNLFMDVSLSSVLILSSYITFNDGAFELVYGKKAAALVSFLGSCGRSYSKKKVSNNDTNPSEEKRVDSTTESKNPQISTPNI